MLMSVWSNLGAGARAAAVAGGSAVVAATGWFVWPASAPVVAPVAAPLVDAEVPAVVATAKPAAVAVPEAVAADVAAVDTVVPDAVAPDAVATQQVAVEPAAVEPTPVEPAAAEPVAVETALAEPAPAAPLAAAPVAEPVPLPRFDVVRVEPDGTATVAGNAAAGAVVSLRVDGVEVVQAVADAQGSFATLFTLPGSAVPRLLSLVAVAPDGVELIGPDTVALAATVAAAVPAAVEPAAVEPAATASAEVPASDAPPAVEPTAPAALLVTQDGVQVLQPGADVPAEIAANVSIDTIAYAPDGAVQLGGRGAGAAFVRLYLDDVEAATVLVAEGGQWAAVLSDVAPGIYTLRADQVGADGKVTSRFETPFKRETLQALAAAAAVVAEPAPVVAPVAEPAVAAADPVAEPVAEPAAGVPQAPAVEPAPVEPVAVEPAPVEPAPVEPAPVEPAPAEPAPAAPVSVEPTPAEPVPAKPAAVSVTVQPGFTLWGIAQDRFGDGVLYVQVFEANKDKIKDPDLIYPGQIFTLPAAQ